MMNSYSKRSRKFGCKSRKKAERLAFALELQPEFKRKAQRQLEGMNKNCKKLIKELRSIVKATSMNIFESERRLTDNPPGIPKSVPMDGYKQEESHIKDEL